MAEADGGFSAESFAVLLRRLRVLAALSQEALAERAGVSTRAVSDLERGIKTRPRLETVRLLADGLRLDPGARTALVAAARPAEMRPPVPGSGLPSRADLPISSTPIIGREAEIAAVCALLRDPAVRLVTLTGPGGVGKTRLAIEVARSLGDDFEDGARFVSLAAVSDSGAVAGIIAQALGLRETGTQAPEERLRVFLGGRHLLLILDNFEQVVEAGPAVAHLLTDGTDSKLLITSREPLRVDGEHEFAVSPLALPPADGSIAHNGPDLAPAVQLFVARARAARSDFMLSPTNAPTVAAICRRLDGLPLALELAAAHVKVLPPPALLARLARPLLLLSGGRRDLPARQQTMRDTIAWSYALLTPAEQQLFRTLAVFVGGCTLEAAEAVVGDDAPDDTLGGIAALVDKSLLRLTEGDGAAPRYVMLETVREFGFERLTVDGDPGATHRSYAAHFLALAEASTATIALPDGRTPADPSAIDRLAAEEDNLRAAYAWLLEADPSDCLRLAAACAPFWSFREQIREGYGRLTCALATAPVAATEARGRALLWAVGFALVAGDVAAAARHAQAGREVWNAIGDPRGRALALTHAAWVEEIALRFDAAIDLFEQAITAWQDLGEPLSVGSILMVLGGIRYWHTGDLAAAEAAEEAAAAIFQDLGENGWVARTDWYRGLFAGARRRFDEAARRYHGALRGAIEDADTQLRCKALIGLAATAAEIGLPETAALFLGHAEAARERIGYELFPGDRPAYERATELARSALGEHGFAAAHAAGSGLETPQLLVAADAIVAAAAIPVPTDEGSSGPPGVEPVSSTTPVGKRDRR